MCPAHLTEIFANTVYGDATKPCFGGRCCVAPIWTRAWLLALVVGPDPRVGIGVQAHAPTPGGDWPATPGRALGRSPKYDDGWRGRPDSPRAPELADRDAATAPVGQAAPPGSRSARSATGRIEPDRSRKAAEWPADRFHRSRGGRGAAPGSQRGFEGCRARAAGRGHGAREGSDKVSGNPHTALIFAPSRD